MAGQRYISSMLWFAGILFASACDNADILSAPKTSAVPGSTLRPDTQIATPTGPGPMLSGLGTNMCADVWQASRTPGAAVVAYGCHGGANQQFVLQSNGTITAYDGALCLDVWQAKANDGDPVVVYTCNGGANQRWTRTAAGELQTAVNGKCLDLWGAQAVNGAKLSVHSCHGGANQKWTVNNAIGVVIAQPIAPVDTSALTTPISAGTGSSATTTGGSAELPRTYLNTAMPTPTGRTITVAAGGDLQAALDAAQPGDVVTLPAGATFVGNFQLRPKAGMVAGQWITVRTAGTLPLEGNRVGPGNAAQMPKLLTPNQAPALETVPGAQGWRLVGLEIGVSSQASFVYNLVAFGSTGSEQSTVAQVASRLVLDRAYLHGTPALDVRRCLALNSASSAVIDSYFADCHQNGSDSQAIMGWNGPGPFKIVNNHLEGGHEVVMFGGGDPSLPGVVPSDIEFRRNHVTRPLSWRGVWQVKNLLELKAGQRVLVEGNVFENNWASAQNGFAFVWWSVNQEGGCTWCVTQDVTFRYNQVKNVPQGFNLSATGGNTSVPMRRVTIVHNVVTGLDGRAVQIGGTIDGLTIRNNSAPAGSQDVYFITPDAPVPTLVYRDNVGGSQYGLFADGGAMGNNVLTKMRIPAANVTGNVLYSSSGPSVVPTGNTYVGSVGAIGFANLGAGDLTLSASSPYSTAGTGGARPGADVTTISQMTQGVVR